MKGKFVGFVDNIITQHGDYIVNNIYTITYVDVTDDTVTVIDDNDLCRWEDKECFIILDNEN